jgi:hypothetical protein
MQFNPDETFWDFPVVIDDSQLLSAREPRVVRQVQATRISGGIVDDGSAARIFARQQRRLAAPHKVYMPAGPIASGSTQVDPERP